MEYQNALSKSMEDLYDADGNGLNLIEFGSGRGSISMEAVYNFIRGNGNGRNDLHLVLVDKDMEALEKAKGIAEANDLSGNVRIKRYNVKNVSSLEPYNNFHIAGTHGLLDYFSDEEAVKFFQDVGDILVPKGNLVTTNMTPHDDWVAQKLMETFGNWMLIYRTPEEFRKLIEKSGRYEILDTKVVTDKATYTLNGEPTYDDIKGFHVLITARKKD